MFGTKFYYMAEESVCQIMHVDWLLSGQVSTVLPFRVIRILHLTGKLIIPEKLESTLNINATKKTY